MTGKEIAEQTPNSAWLVASGTLRWWEGCLYLFDGEKTRGNGEKEGEEECGEGEGNKGEEVKMDDEQEEDEEMGEEDEETASDWHLTWEQIPS